jgi:hypothetical protein
MKTNPLIRRLVLISALGLPATLPALEVHEWGTFTVLLSSDGRTTNWYQPYSDIAQLPPFTADLIRMKSAIGPAQVRMETPVIYFYPKEEMNVKVKVLFRDGKITERFPAAMDEAANPYSRLESEPGVITSFTAFQNRLNEIIKQTHPAVTQWSGKLLAPIHSDAKLIPSVAGHKGENYGAAREVPDAWIFRSDLTPTGNPPTPQVEKFIFYRGAGQEVPPYRVTMVDEQTMTFSNFSHSASEFQVALRVRDGKASWKQMPSLPEPKDQAERSATITLPEESISLEQADAELSAVFLTELVRRGLTQDEAKAMIKTWNHTWFTEPGQRVFTIVDRGWVDSVLPLAISPNPQKMERVFVARFEILSPGTEDKLAALLREDKPTEQVSESLKALQLGRFANGAAQLLADQAKNATLSRFRSLSQ